MNAGLVDLGVRAVDLRQEGAWFAFEIRSALRTVERHYGDGFLNSVRVDLIDESEFRNGGAIADVRKHIAIRPVERSQHYHACRELIANGIGGRAVELRDRLKYSPEEITEVMTRALASYLDSRFSVSNRRRFGML